MLIRNSPLRLVVFRQSEASRTGRREGPDAHHRRVIWRGEPAFLIQTVRTDGKQGPSHIRTGAAVNHPID